jgi:two-component system alkaline phosphatase synthesis response regulator PhoP
VNIITYEVYKEGGFLEELSKREVELLKLFDEHEGEVVSRDFILDQLWGTESFPTTRTIDNYILSFRKLFEEDPKNPKYFHSIRGVGYKFTKG